jgi:two-component sensor histidine kinase
MHSRFSPPFRVRSYFLALVTAVVLPLVFFSAYIFNRQVMVERERLFAQATDLAQHVAVVVDAELTSLVASLQGLATSSALRKGDFRLFYDEAARLTAGKDQVVVLREFGPLQRLNTQAAFGTVLPPAVDIPVTDQATLRSGKPVISPVYASPLSGETRVAVAIAVMAKEQTHVLAVTVPTTRFRRVLPTVPAGWIIGIGDPRSGRFVTRSQHHDDASGKLADPQYFAKATGTSGSFEGTTLEGRRVIAAYYYGDVSGWLAAANVPRSVIEAPLWQSLYVLAALGVGALVLSTLLAWFLGRRVTSAATELATRAVALGAGERVNPSALTVSEFQDVSDALAASGTRIKEREQQRDKVEVQRQQLIAELDHRVKNTLAVVQSLLVQTLRHAHSLDDARTAFSHRLQALSAAHDILTRENWGSADLHDLINRVTAPYGTREQFRMMGPPIRLPPPLTVSFAMVFNELATNAVRYGALSVEGGYVSLTWFVDAAADQLRIEWQETGGPALSPPAKEGFGAKLIRDILPGTTTVRYRTEGLACRIAIPMGAIGAGARARP